MTDTPESLPPTTWNRHTLTWGAKTWVMGILNITPDSFSQDGLAADGVATDAIVASAVARARQMVSDGPNRRSAPPCARRSGASRR